MTEEETYPDCTEVEAKDVPWAPKHPPHSKFVIGVLLRFEKLKRGKALRFEYPDKASARADQAKLTSSDRTRRRLGKGVFETRKLQEGEVWALYVKPGPNYVRGLHTKDTFLGEQWGKGFDKSLQNREDGKPNTAGRPRKAPRVVSLRQPPNSG